MKFRVLLSLLQLGVLLVYATPKCDINEFDCSSGEIFDNESCVCMTVLKNCEENTEYCASIQCDTPSQKLSCPITCKTCSSQLSVRFSLFERVREHFKSVLIKICALFLPKTVCDTVFNEYQQTTVASYSTTPMTTITTSFQGEDFKIFLKTKNYILNINLYINRHNIDPRWFKRMVWQ